MPGLRVRTCTLAPHLCRTSRQYRNSGSNHRCSRTDMSRSPRLSHTAALQIEGTSTAPASQQCYLRLVGTRHPCTKHTRSQHCQLTFHSLMLCTGLCMSCASTSLPPIALRRKRAYDTAALQLRKCKHAGFYGPLVKFKHTIERLNCMLDNRTHLCLCAKAPTRFPKST